MLDHSIFNAIPDDGTPRSRNIREAIIDISVLFGSRMLPETRYSYPGASRVQRWLDDALTAYRVNLLFPEDHPKVIRAKQLIEQAERKLRE
jgi:hypothetical protein